MEKLVSVVIPVYKVEKYLDRCAESIFAQTYKNIEIVFVDDGSPDNCPKMCDEYALKDSRVKVVHKANGGLPDARNAGINVATGDYILFVDSDDWIEQNTIEELLKIIDEHSVDFVTFGAVWDGRQGIPDGTPCTCEKSRELGLGYYDEKRIMNEIYPRLFVTHDLFFGPILSACFSIYSKKFLDDNGVRFDPEVKYSEDSVFSSKMVYAAKSFYVTNKCFYHYCFNNASISTTFHKDIFEVEKLRYEFIERHFKDSKKYDFTTQLRRLKLCCLISALSKRRTLPADEKREYVVRVFNDPFTRDAVKHVGVAKVPFKKKLMLYLIKFKILKIYMKM